MSSKDLTPVDEELGQLSGIRLVTQAQTGPWPQTQREGGFLWISCDSTTHPPMPSVIPNSHEPSSGASPMEKGLSPIRSVACPQFDWLAKRVKELLGQAGERRPLRPFRLWSLRISLTALLYALLLIPWPGEDGGLGAILAAVRAEEATPTRPTEPPVATSDGGTTSAAKTPSNPSLPPAVANPPPTATTAAEARSLPQVLLSVSLVSINDHSDDEIGLDWLFGQRVTNTSPAVSVPASRIRGLETPLRGEGVRVDLMTVEGQSAVLSQAQFAALKAGLERRQGVDFLAAPKVTTLSGRQAQVSISDILTLVTGVELREASATNQSGIGYLTEKVPQGVLVDLVPELEGNAWRLKILASITEFRGYDRPERADRIRVDHGKPGFEKAVVPLPRLRVREVNASNTVRNGDVLALRGPLMEEILQFKDKVPVLGDIPLLGRLFRKESSQTRRSRLYVFVQPEEVDGSGQKIVRP